MYARAAKDRNFKILKGREAKVKEAVENGEPIHDVAEAHRVSYTTIQQFVELHGIKKRKPPSHPAVAHLEEVPLYKLWKNEVDQSKDYVISRRGRDNKVFIGVDEYIELKERAKHAKDMADAGASAGLVNGLLFCAD